MYQNWQAQPGVPAQQMQYYSAPNAAYQQQMYQWYYQQQGQVPPQPGVQAQPPVPTSMPPLPEAAPPPPSEEKPPLPPEPPPAPPAEDEKQDNLQAVSAEEQKKLTDLQQQAAQWQQTQQTPPLPQQQVQIPQQQTQPLQQQQQQWPQQQQWQQQQQQWQGYQPSPAPGLGDASKVQFEAIQKEESDFEQQYSQWKQQYEDWKRQNQNHPNKEQFKLYEAQWQQYEHQMEDKKKDIQQRKQMIQSQIAVSQPQPVGAQPGMPGQPVGPTNQQHGVGMPPSGMPPNQMGNQGLMGQNPGQMMGGLSGMQQNVQGQRMNAPGGFRQNNPQRMEGPGGQRMRFPHQNDNNRMQNPQQMRMGGPRGQIRMQLEGNQPGNMNQPNQGGPRQRFPGGPRFGNQNNQMNRMPGPRGPMGRGQRQPLAQNNPFRQSQVTEQEEGFGEGGEEDMCLEEENESEHPSFGDNPFRRPDIQKMVAEEEEENEEMDENSMGNMGLMHRQQGFQQNMNLRGLNPNQFRGQGQGMRMRGNFQKRGGPMGMGGPRGLSQPNLERMPTPQKGPISLMDLRFDKPPPNFLQKNEKDQNSENAGPQKTGVPGEQSDVKKDSDSVEKGTDIKLEVESQKEFAVGQAEKTALSGLGKGDIPGFGDGTDAQEEDKVKKEEEKKGEAVVGDSKKEGEQESGAQEVNEEVEQSQDPPAENFAPGFGPGGFGPNQGQGPRHFGPNQGRGPGHFGPRQFGPNQGQVPRQFGPNQGQTPQQFGQNQRGPRPFGPGQGPRPFGPNQQQNRFRQRGQDRGRGPRNFGPRGFNQNQGPRGFGLQNQLGQGGFQEGEESSEQYVEQDVGQSDEPLAFQGNFNNRGKPDRGIRGRGRGQNFRGRGRGLGGWNMVPEEQAEPLPEPEPEVYDEEEEKERLRREMEEEGEQWMASHQEDLAFDRRREGWPERRTPPLHGDRYDRHPYDDPYRGDPYYDRHDPYYDRRDPYYDDRRAYDYDSYRRPDDYWYPDRYPAPPPAREPSPRLYVAPEVIDHGHKSSTDYGAERETIEYKPPEVIDYGHGKSSDDQRSTSEPRDDHGSYRPESEYSRDSYDYSRSRDYGRDSHKSSDYSRDRDRDRDRSSSKQVHEPKVETVSIDDLLLSPGRKHRPPQIVVILRGLPGSGKTYVGKLIKDKEVQNGGGAPRMLCLDDYFMVEVEKTEKDPETGKKVKKKILEYEFEPEMESSYRKNMYKSFKKTIDDGFFPFIIVDAVNEKERHFEEFWSYAKSKGFQVYIAEIQADVPTCVKRNTHNRKQEEIEKIEKGWQETPKHYLRLDIRPILQEVSIQEVEMDLEDDAKPAAPPASTEKRKKEEEDEDPDIKFGGYKKSKWEIEPSGKQLDKLDGLIHNNKKIAPAHQTMEDFLQLTDDYDTRPLAPGQKRVRWADIEERKLQSRRRDIGFVVGQTQRDWERITDDSFADRQLNRTKYF